MIDAEKYPEFAKLNDIPEHDRQLLGSFIEHLQDALGIDMCEMETRDGPYYYRGKAFLIEALIASYYDIDFDQYKIEKEAAMQEALVHQRALNEKVANE